MPVIHFRHQYPDDRVTAMVAIPRLKVKQPNALILKMQKLLGSQTASDSTLDILLPFSFSGKQHGRDHCCLRMALHQICGISKQFVNGKPLFVLLKFHQPKKNLAGGKPEQNWHVQRKKK